MIVQLLSKFAWGERALRLPLPNTRA